MTGLKVFIPFSTQINTPAMKIKIYHSILFVLIQLLVVFTSWGQNLSTKGKDFWIAFMQNAHESDVTLHVYVSSETATSGTISIPLGGWSQTFTVAANSTTDIVVPENLAEPQQNQVALGMGVHVVADTIVSVYALDYEAYTSDASVILPVQSLGYDYWVIANKGLNSAAYPSEFVILSLTDGTVVEITPSAVTTNANAAGVPFNVTLDSGEVYQVQEGYNIDVNGELTGTRVRAVDSNSCHKFALFAGSRCSFLPDNYCCCDLLYEQMVPINTWGKTYYTVPLQSRTSDFIRVVASEDNTQFTVNNGSPITLNAGGYYDFTETDASIVAADKPVDLAQYSPSFDWDNANGDPFMVLISPIEQDIDLITYNAFTSNVITNYYLNLVSPTLGTGIITLDGSLIGAGNFTAYTDDPNYSYAQLSISQGNHTLQSDSGFVAYVYGFGGYESFGYGGGTNVNILPLSFDIVYNGDTINYLSFHDTIGCPGLFTVIAHGDTSYTSFQWDFGDGTTSTQTSAEHSYSSNGAYTVTLYGFKSNQCAADAVSALVIQGSVQNIFPSFNITYNGNTSLYSSFFDTIICNYTVDFSAFFDAHALHYNWNFGDGTGASGQNVTHTFDSSGVFTITLSESDDSCYQGHITWTIVVAGGNNLNPLFYIIYNGDTTLFSEFHDTIGCHRDFEFIAYYDPTIVEYNWFFGDGSSTVGQDVFHTYSSSGDYTVTLHTIVEESCLDTTITQIIHIVDSIGVSIPDTGICFGGTLLLTADITGNPNIVWSTGETTPTIEISDPGTYSITGTLDNCTVTDFANIFDVPEINDILPPLDSVCEESKVPTLIQANPYHQYLWNTGDTTSSILADTAGLYSVLVTDNNGCKGDDTILVVKYCPPFVIFPLAFSPNADGVNDGFGPLGLHILTITYTVYNRWGELLFTGNSLTDRWNGKYKGDQQAVDVYVYTCSYTDDVDLGVMKRLAGNVTLVR